MKKKILGLLVCLASMCSYSFTITFKVDMSMVATFNTPEVNGTFNGWCGNCSAMSDLDSDNIWEISIPLDAGTYEYKFSYDAWTGQEALEEGSSCTVTSFGFTNRLLVVNANQELPTVCWNSCTSCAKLSTFSVTFQVDMSNAVGYTLPEVNGTFNGWCGNCFTMTDANNDDIWEATTQLDPGNYEYKFSYDNWAGSEYLTPGGSCTNTTGSFTNRTLIVNTNLIIPIVCWGSCQNCIDPTPVEVTFNLNANTPTTTNAFLSGNFNNYCSNCQPMTLNNGVYSANLVLTPGVYEYYFGISDGTISENLVDGNCTVSNNGIVHRIATVTEATSIPAVCWESCSDCSQDIEDLSMVNWIVYPNPASDIVNVISNNALNSYLKIYNANGALIEERSDQQNFVIQTEKLDAGIYFFILQNEYFRTTEKVIIQK